MFRLRGGHCTSCASLASRVTGQKVGASWPSSRSSLPSPTFRCYVTYSRPHHFGVFTFKLADIGEGIAEVELLKNFKKVGDDVEEMEQVCEVQSDKAAVEITSRFTGKVVKMHHNEGDIIKIGGALMDIEVEGEENTAATTHSAPNKPPPPPKSVSGSKSPPAKGGKSSSSSEVLAPPRVRRFAKEKGVDLTTVTGSGPGGRVTMEDVESASKGESSHEANSTASSPSSISVTTPKNMMQPGAPKEDRDITVRGFARAMVKSMKEAVEVPHLNVGEDVDITDLIHLRSSLVSSIEKEKGVRLTLTSFLVKAMSLAINDYPIINSKFNAVDNDKYRVFGSHNISIAMDTPNGLVVPVLKGVESLSIIAIQNNLTILSQKAKANKLSQDDLVGGTVSLSNVGVIGGTYVKALLFDGQASILAVGRVIELPRFDSNGQVVCRKIINLGLSADHRHVDGATAARYITTMKKYLENPGSMLLSMT